MNLSRRAIIRTYSKEIVYKAHLNSVRFFSITQTELIFESAIVGHFEFLAPLIERSVLESYLLVVKRFISDWIRISVNQKQLKSRKI